MMYNPYTRFPSGSLKQELSTLPTMEHFGGDMKMKSSKCMLLLCAVFTGFIQSSLGGKAQFTAFDVRGLKDPGRHKLFSAECVLKCERDKNCVEVEYDPSRSNACSMKSERTDPALLSGKTYFQKNAPTPESMNEPVSQSLPTTPEPEIITQSSTKQSVEGITDGAASTLMSSRMSQSTTTKATTQKLPTSHAPEYTSQPSTGQSVEGIQEGIRPGEIADGDAPSLMSCAEATTSGEHTVLLDENGLIPVYCFVDTEGTNWIVIQNRTDTNANFFRNWDDYKTGFGDLLGDHWLGNDIIHLLTSQGYQRLRIDLVDENNIMETAEYATFIVDDESHNYTLTISGYSSVNGDVPGDSMDKSVGQQFSTIDRDNDVSTTMNCAARHESGWWFGSCTLANPNGQFGKASKNEGVFWKSWRNMDQLRSVRMMIN